MDRTDNAPADPDDRVLDVLVVGAGQAGLALASHLKDDRVDHLLVDAAPRVGHSWRTRWDSLMLFSPARYDALPGMPFPGEQDRYPGKDEVADYLEAYAERLGVPLLLDAEVQRVAHAAGVFEVGTTRGPLRARQVVVATGPFSKPRTPAIAEGLAPEVVSVHSARYTSPASLPEGPVLVVGAGNSGLQIAEELAARGETHLAVGTSAPRLPQRVLGRDLFWWLALTGVVRAPVTSRIGRRLKARGELVIGTSEQRVERLGVRLRPRLVGADGDSVTFEDGSTLRPAAVVWATGFTPDYAWLEVPGVVEGGSVRHERGRTAVPGLYFLGLPWQHSRGSALLGFVADDAAYVAGALREERAVSRP